MAAGQRPRPRRPDGRLGHAARTAQRAPRGRAGAPRRGAQGLGAGPTARPSRCCSATSCCRGPTSSCGPAACRAWPRRCRTWTAAAPRSWPVSTLDVLAQTRETVDAEHALRVVVYKSAKYTVERPLHVGAALAGADQDLIDRLSDVALPLGAAFQLRDDVLGVFGDPAQTGKPAGDDLREGKRTLLVARTEELADDGGRTLVRRLLGTSEGIDVLRDLIVSCGALAAVEAEIAQLQQQAEAAIAGLPERRGARRSEPSSTPPCAAPR
ncbi:MAG: polyprenyl synthetase family protein [Aeromicrobium erythreum]